MEANERQVLYYVPCDGSDPPFRVWLHGMTEKRTRAAIAARIARLRAGNFSDSRPIGNATSETRIDFGPGYRIYYGVDGTQIILLNGGEKSSQGSDIEAAKGYWRDYRERKKNEKARRLQSRSPR